MSVLARQETGGSLPSGLQLPPSFNISAPFIILPISTIPGPASSLITISTATTSTFSTTSYQTVSTTTSTFITQTLPVTVIPTASLTAQQTAIKSNASLTKTNTIIIGALCGFTLLLILALGLFAFVWIRRLRRGRGRQESSPPLTSLAAGVSQPSKSQQGPAQAASSPLDLREALSSHPPNPNRISFSRPFSPAGFHVEAFQSQPSPQSIPLPVINVQPNTPSVVARDEDFPVSPILQASPARTPLYETPSQEDTAEGSARLGLPVPELEAQRASVSSVGSEYEDGLTQANTPERVAGVLPSTRASSGVFPESS